MDAVLDAAALSSPLDTTDAQQRRLQQLEQERAGIKARIEQRELTIGGAGNRRCFPSRWLIRSRRRLFCPIALSTQTARQC